MASTAKIPAPRSTPSGSASLVLPILLALLSAVLLDFCFPVAGPMHPWQPWLAFVALIPLLAALLNPRAAAHPRYFRRATLTAYTCGVLWYILNCYWIYQTMLLYGHVPALGSAGMVFLFSAVLGLYFALFGLLTAFFRRRFGLLPALALAPFLWTALDLAAARITSVPWDQLGYSQINNLALTRLAPVTGAYGITFVLVAANAALLAIWIAGPRARRWIQLSLLCVLLALLLTARFWSAPPPDPTSAYAVLLQPNRNVAADTSWQGSEWSGSPAWLLQQSLRTCTPAYNGMPQSGLPSTTPASCAQNTPPPGVVLWPEVASWFISDNPQTLATLHALALTAHAPVIAGMLGQDPSGTYNSAVFVEPDGSIAGRYDKIHLVPFGEYIPMRRVFFFAHKLTQQLEDLDPGHQRIVFHTDHHTFGVFICYESVFADEVRRFALNGAQVLVNLSDDGWYGDTSAPWQHLDMTRMRAVENHRWLLLDTNNGVTSVIDPHGRVTLSAARHHLTTLVARYGYRTDQTFYTRHGDLFAWLCVVIVLTALAFGFLRPRPASESDARPSLLS